MELNQGEKVHPNKVMLIISNNKAKAVNFITAKTFGTSDDEVVLSNEKRIKSSANFYYKIIED